ncbi:MAG: hypothetical protein V1824_01010 [archaeon]
MTKSLEVAIAIIILLFFYLTIISFSSSSNATSNINEEIRDYIYLNAKTSEFRSLVENNDINKIYELINSNTDYKINLKICDYINSNCSSYSDISQFENIASYDYYFYDINKTIYVITINE